MNSRLVAACGDTAARVGLGDHPDLAGLRSIPWDEGALGTYQAALILTDHESVDYGALLKLVPVVVDTRNVTAALGSLSDQVIKA